MSDLSQAILNMQTAIARDAGNWRWLEEHKDEITEKDAGLENKNPQSQEKEKET